MQCSNCSAAIQDYEAACPQCGTKRILDYRGSDRRVATVDEAFAFLPANTLDNLKPLPEANAPIDNLKPLPGVTIPLTSRADYLGVTTELPYRFGKVYAALNIVGGAAFILVSLFSLANDNTPSLIFAALGIYNISCGIGLYNKAQWGLIMFYISLGLSVLLAIGSLASGNPYSLFGLIANAPIAYYFYKRADEFA
jgi:hypothetical protein